MSAMGGAEGEGVLTGSRIPTILGALTDEWQTAAQVAQKLGSRSAVVARELCRLADSSGCERKDTLNGVRWLSRYRVRKVAVSYRG